jgi:hypothetical protein
MQRMVNQWRPCSCCHCLESFLKPLPFAASLDHDASTLASSWRSPAVCRAAGMLQARSTTDAIFGDLGIAADSVERLKVMHAHSINTSNM